MSHFTGLVILTPSYLEGHDLEDALAKYDEGLEVPQYSRGEVSEFDKIRFIDYYVDKVNSDNLKEQLYSELLKAKKVKRYLEKRDGTRERYLYQIANENKDRYVELFKETYQQYYDMFEDLYSEHGEDWNCGGWRINPETGIWEEYSTYNPDSKWDWYDLNGRWSDSIKTKSDEYVNECLLEEIDWTDFKPEDYEEEEKSDLWGKKYKPLKENVRWHFTENNVPYCLVIDGNWYEKGEMGWFGLSDDKMTDEEWSKKFMEAIKDLPGDSLVYNVDYHI